MVVLVVTGGLTGFDGPLNGGEKVFPPDIAQRLLQVAGKPKLDAVIGQPSGHRIEIAMQLVNPELLT